MAGEHGARRLPSRRNGLACAALTVVFGQHTGEPGARAPLPSASAGMRGPTRNGPAFIPTQGFRRRARVLEECVFANGNLGFNEILLVPPLPVRFAGYSLIWGSSFSTLATHPVNNRLSGPCKESERPISAECTSQFIRGLRAFDGHNASYAQRVSLWSDRQRLASRLQVKRAETRLKLPRQRPATFPSALLRAELGNGSGQG